jgi:hypothetical protein
MTELIVAFAILRTCPKNGYKIGNKINSEKKPYFMHCTRIFKTNIHLTLRTHLHNAYKKLSILIKMKHGNDVKLSVCVNLVHTKSLLTNKS